MTRHKLVLLTAMLPVWAIAAAAQAPDLSRMDFILKSVPNGPVALVNGTPVPAETFRDFYVGELVHWDKTNPGEEVTDQLRIGIALRVLRQLIEREVLYQEAVARKITISDADLATRWEQEFEKIRQSLPEAQQGNVTDAQVFERIGSSREEALNDLRTALMVNEMRERIIEEAGQAVTDKEVADWYAENAELTVRPATIHVKQIFFKVDTSQRATDPDKALKDAEKRAADAYALIQSGQAFEKIAKERSEGQFADNGGDWGSVPAVQLPPFIVEAAQKLQPGQTSAPFQSQYGFHIVRLIASTPGGKVPLDQAAPEIRRLLMRDKGDDAVRKYCAKLMADESKVQVFLDLERQLRLRPELLELYRNEVGKPTAQGN